MKIVTAFISDRGDKYLPGCLESFWKHVDPKVIAEVFTVDDYEHKLGMAGAAAEAWAIALDLNADYLLHVEEDFRFTERIDLAGMVQILERRPAVAQVALKRQPWSAEEAAAGGFMELDPGAYVDMMNLSGLQWVEHRKLFTLNPCLIPRRVLETIEPCGEGGGAERNITDLCLAQGWSFAYYGHSTDKPRVEHVGLERGGSGWRW